MKILYFEGAGCEGTQVNDVENCRIRTAFTNKDGRKIYLELISGGKNIYKGNKFISIPGYMYVDYCHYITNEPEIHDCNAMRLSCERDGVERLYTKTGILNLVNEKCNGDFDAIEILPFLSGYRVHADTNIRNTYSAYNYGDEFINIPERTKERERIYNVVAKEYFNKIYQKHIKLNPSANRLLSKYSTYSLVGMTDKTITIRSYTYKELIDDNERVKTFKVSY